MCSELCTKSWSLSLVLQTSSILVKFTTSNLKIGKVFHAIRHTDNQDEQPNKKIKKTQHTTQDTWYTKIFNSNVHIHRIQNSQTYLLKDQGNIHLTRRNTHPISLHGKKPGVLCVENERYLISWVVLSLEWYLFQFIVWVIMGNSLRGPCGFTLQELSWITNNSVLVIEGWQWALLYGKLNNGIFKIIQIQWMMDTR